MEALHTCIKEGKIEEAREIMAKAGIQIGEKGLYLSSGLTLLHAAANRDNLNVVQFLLQEGADINEAAQKGSVYAGYTPLHFAAENSKSLQILIYLLTKNADVTLKEATGRTALHIAALKGNHKGAKALLASCNMDRVNEQDTHGRTPLMLACSQGQRSVVQCIIKYHLSEEEEDQNRKFWIEDHHFMNIPDAHGNTALHHCFQAQSQALFNYNYTLTEGHYDSAIDLIINGADVRLQNHVQETPLDVIHYALADLLEVLSDEKEKLSGKIKTLENLTELTQRDLEATGISSENLIKFVGASLIYAKAKEKEIALKKIRGSCPFVSTSQTPPIRKFKEQYLQEQECGGQEEEGEEGDMPIKPNHLQFSEYMDIKKDASGKPGVCPFGFVGEMPANHPEMVASTLNGNVPPKVISNIMEQNRARKSEVDWESVKLSLIGAGIFALVTIGVQYAWKYYSVN